jgi:hypothetical protein
MFMPAKRTAGPAEDIRPERERTPGRRGPNIEEGAMTMAVEGRINVRHEDIFTQPVLVLSVDAVEDFDKKRAGNVDPQDIDKQTGMRLWSVSVLDPTAPQGRREIKVKIAADAPPAPPNGLMSPAEFDGLQVIPYLDSNRAKPRVGIAYRATGFRIGRQTRASA